MKSSGIVAERARGVNHHNAPIPPSAETTGDSAGFGQQGFQPPDVYLAEELLGQGERGEQVADLSLRAQKLPDIGAGEHESDQRREFVVFEMVGSDEFDDVNVMVPELLSEPCCGVDF